MDGLRCAVCKEHFLVGESVKLIANTGVVSENGRVIYDFDVNEEGDQEICAVHPRCGVITLHFIREGVPQSITVL